TIRVNTGTIPSLQTGTGSVLVGRDDLAALDGAQGPPGDGADRVLDELDAAVGEQGVHPARMPAAGRERHVGRAAVVLVDRVPVHREGSARDRGPGGPADGRDVHVRGHGR